VNRGRIWHKAGNVTSFSLREKVGRRGKETCKGKCRPILLRDNPFPLTLALSLGERGFLSLLFAGTVTADHS